MFNSTLLNKWKWLYLNDIDAMQYELLDFKYSPLPQKIVNRDEIGVESKDSLWWRDIMYADENRLDGRSFCFTSNLVYKVGNDENTTFQTDYWL